MTRWPWARRRWVVVPLSSDPRLKDHPLTVAFPATTTNGPAQTTFAMAWLPTTVAAEQLEGPIGRIDRDQLNLPAQPATNSLTRRPAPAADPGRR
jgi:hypothetical protein